MWVIPIKDKKGTNIVNPFQKIISEGLIEVVNFMIILLKIF